MGLEYYLIFFGLLIVCALFSGWASRKVYTTYAAYAEDRVRSNMTGYDTAVRLLRANGIYDVSIGRVKGRLSDHFHPTKKIVNLSETTFGDNSVAAVAVAAHEIGHVVQKERGYIPYKIRTALVPITNFGARLALPLVLVGLLLELWLGLAGDYGYIVAMIGVALYGLSTVFTLVTLPVELDASRRARKMLVEEGIITTEDEEYGAKKVLSAAAMTYLAALLTSLVYFLRFALWVIMLFGGRRRD
ncbi:MAG: zinc metallopeptidase [Clostridia bacterium]|nr:zinc metallopeptidase [Clostridia bacterium]